MNRKILGKFFEKAVSGLIVFALVFGVFGNTKIARAAVPLIIAYQGRLTDSSGNLLGGAGGTTYYFKFSIWDNQNVGSGSKLWPSTAPSTTTATVATGVFNVNIGDTAGGYPDTLDYDFSTNSNVFLQVEVSSDSITFETLAPRQRITSAGFAINAGTLGGFTASQTPTASNIPVLTSGNLLLAGTNPQLNATSTNTLTLQGGTGTGDIQFFSSSNKITSGGNLTIAGILSAPNISFTNATGTGNLQVATFNSTGNGTVAGQLSVTSGISAATTTVTGTSTLAGVAASYVTNSGNTMLLGSLNVGGVSSLATTTVLGLTASANGVTLASSTPFATANTLYNLGGSLYFNGAAISAGSAASGTAGLIQFSNGSGGFNSNALFNWDNGTNRLALGTTASPSSTLHVVGSATITGQSTLAAASSTNFSASGFVTVSGDLNVGGTSALAGVTFVNATGTGNLQVATFNTTGNGTIAGQLSITSGISAATSTITGTSTLAGVSATFLSNSGASMLTTVSSTNVSASGFVNSGSLNVSGTSTLAGASHTFISNSGNTMLSGSLNVGATSTLAGISGTFLSNSGASMLQGVSSTNLSASGFLNVGGALALTGAAVLNSTLSVTGTSTLATTTAPIIQTSFAGVPATLLDGTIWYDSAAGKYKIREGGSTKIVCNTTDAGCGSAGGSASGTAGLVQFSDGAGAFNSNSLFFWNNASNTLALGTSAIASSTLHVVGTSTLTGISTTFLANSGASMLQGVSSTNVSASGFVSGGSLSISGATILGGALTATGGTSTLAGTAVSFLANSGASMLQGVSSTNVSASGFLNVGGAFALTGAAALGSTLNVTGISTFATTTATGLTVSTNGITITSSTPMTTTNTLYNLGSTLFFNGSALSTASPSGTAGIIQFSNGSGAFNGNSLFKWDNTNNRLGLGTTATPSSTLHVVGDFIVTATSSMQGQTTIPNLIAGALTFEADAGQLSWVDLPVSSAATSTVQSYSAQIDGIPLLSIYAESNGSGGTSNEGVAIGTSTPAGLFTVGTATSSPTAPFFNITRAGLIGIGTSATPSSTLHVIGTIQSSGNAAIGGQVAVTSGISAATTTITGTSTLAGVSTTFLANSGASMLQGVSSTNLSASGFINGASLSVSGATILGGALTATGGTSTLAGISGTFLSNSGNTMLSGSLNVGATSTLVGTALTFLSNSGNTMLSGSLNVGATSTLVGTALTFLSNSGNTMLGGTLNVTATSTLLGRVSIGTTTPATQQLALMGGFIQSHANPVITATVASSSLTTGVGIYVSGKYAYITSSASSSLNIVDISTPSSPVIVGIVRNTSTLNAPNSVYVSGKYAYVAATGDNSIRIIDVSNPTAPVIVGGVKDDTNLLLANSVYVSGKYAYVVSLLDNSLRIIDVSNPTAPVIVGGVKDDTNLAFSRSVYVAGKYAYVVSSSDNSLRIIDVSNPAAPVIVGGVKDDTNLNSVNDVYVSGRYAYVTAQGDKSLRIIDVSNPTTPVIVGGVQDNTNLSGISDVHVAGKYAYVTTGSLDKSLRIIDVSSPTTPFIAAGIKDNTILNSAIGVFVSGKYAYVLGSANSSLSIIDISGIDAPAASIGTIAVGTLNVTENADIANNLFVRSALSVGDGGILSNGAISIAGFASSTEGLQNSALYLASSTPATTTNALYTQNGALLWNGLAVSTSTASSSAGLIQFSNGSGGFNSNALFFWNNASNTLAIGTSAIASSTLHVVGTATVTGSSTLAGVSTTFLANSGASMLQGVSSTNITASGFLNVGGALALTGAAVLNSTLAVTATTTLSSGLILPLGSVGNPSFTFSSDNNTGLWSSGADTINFSTAGAERARFDSTGNFAIATTTAASALTIGGAIPIITLNDSTSAGHQFRIRNGSAAVGFLDIFDNSSSTSRLLIDHSGRVGVGVGTARPSSTLHVVGDFTVTATSTLLGPTIIDDLNLGELSFAADSGIVVLADMPISTAAATSTVESYLLNIDGNSLLTLYSTAVGDGTVTNLGVGISTTTPATLLSLSSVAPIITLNDTTAAGHQYRIRNGAGAARLLDIYDNSSSTSRIAIDGTGKVGIATTTPVGNFSVVGSDNSSTTKGITFHGATSTELMVVYNDGSVVVGNPTGAQKGYGTINANAVYDDNTLLTDWKFDLYFDGRVLDEDRELHGDEQIMTIDQMFEYARVNRHLPTIPGRDEWKKRGAFSVGQLSTHLWETVESQALYIGELNNRLKNVELAAGYQLQGHIDGGAQLNPNSDITVKNATFEGSLTVKGPVKFSKDTVGQAKILPGAQTVRIAFASAFATIPIVNITPVGQTALNGTFRQAVTNVSTEGFNIDINVINSEPILFNWSAFGSDEQAQLFVSDGTRIEINIPVIDPLPKDPPPPPPSPDPIPPILPVDGATSTPTSTLPEVPTPTSTPPVTPEVPTPTSTPPVEPAVSSSTDKLPDEPVIGDTSTTTNP